MNFLKKIEWLICLATVMLMSSPAWALRPRKKTTTEKFTNSVETFLGSPMDFPLVIALLAIVVILIIVIIVKSRSGGEYEDRHTKAFGGYFRSRTMKILLIGNKKTEDSKRIFATMEKKLAKVNELNHQIKQNNLHDDDKDTHVFGDNNGNEGKTQYSDESAKRAVIERLRVAEKDLADFVEQFGTLAKLDADIRKLIDLDSVIAESWATMQEAPGFIPDDFKTPWD